MATKKKPAGAAASPPAAVPDPAPENLGDLTRGRKIEMIATADLLPYARNSRTHTTEQINAIAASIREFGFTQPALVRGNPPTIGAGHARVLAAQKLRMPAVPCMRLDDLTDAQFRAYVIADNRLAELAGWDDQVLAVEFDELIATGFATELTGFSPGDLRDVRKRADKASTKNNNQGQTGEDEFGLIPADAISRPGDVWYIGRHRLICGDSLERETWKAHLEGAKVACIATDPPYAIYGSSTGMASDIADDKMVRPFFEAVLRFCRDVLPWFGHLYVFCDWRSYPTIAMSARGVETLELKNTLVWDKGGSGLGSNYANTHEFVAFFHKLPPQTAMGHRAAGVRPVHKPNILRFNRPSGDERKHNAAKPVALMREALENSTDPGDLVLEPFCGSGSTMVAADQLGRICYACDLEPKWVDVTIGRMLKLRELEARLGSAIGPTYSEIARQRIGDDHGQVKH
ncbi:MAG TPA: DNA methyltransferase [Planctomycetota bacterium]|nr:DNA methyltransferase [Planctomycetota bacterium]